MYVGADSSVLSPALKVQTTTEDLLDGYSEFQRICAATENDLSAEDAVIPTM